MQQHSDNKPVCMECGKITDSPSDHAVHLKQHEDEKPFKCSKCNERFCRKQQYLSHLIVNKTNIFIIPNFHQSTFRDTIAINV